MEFPALLRKYREDAGFESARAFFNRLGGRAFFGCTYKQYMNVESGRSVAQPPLVSKLTSGLRVAADERRAREFALGYLRSALGRQELVDFIAAALAGQGGASGAGGTPMRRALARSFAERSESLSRGQSDLLISDFTTYWCFAILNNDRAGWKPEALSRAVGRPLAQVRRALGRLLQARLVAQGAGGRFLCPKVGRVFMHPRDEVFTPRVVPALRGFWEEMAAKRGALLLHQHLLTRAPEAELRSYFPYLAQTVQGADIYSSMDPAPDSGFILIETQVRRLLPF